MVRHKEVNPDKWYVVDMRNPRKPCVGWKEFESRKQTQTYIDTYYGYGVPGFFIARGREILEFGVPFKRGLTKAGTTKYKYLDSHSKQKRKNIRRTLRKQARRAIEEYIVYKWEYPEGVNTPKEKAYYRKIKRRKLLYLINRELDD